MHHATFAKMPLSPVRVGSARGCRRAAYPVCRPKLTLNAAGQIMRVFSIYRQYSIFAVGMVNFWVGAAGSPEWILFRNFGVQVSNPM